MIGRAIISKEGIFNGDRTFPVFRVEKWKKYFSKWNKFFSHWKNIFQSATLQRNNEIRAQIPNQSNLSGLKKNRK